MGGHSYSHHHHHHHGGGGRIFYSSGGGGGSCNGRVVLWAVFILILVLYIVIAAATFPKPGSNDTSLSLSETRIVGIKPAWFDRISADTPNFKFDADTYDWSTSSNAVQFMRFKTQPPLTVTDSWNSDNSVSVGTYDHYYWSWFFYKGSSIRVSWNFNYPVTMYVIRSTNGYDSYYDEDGETSKYIMDQVRSPSGSRSVTVNTDDIYFVIFENWDIAYTVRGSANFSISSRLLDVSNPDESCYLPCGLDVPYGSSDTYVLYTPSVSEYVALGDGTPNSEFNFNVHKSSRVWFVAVILFIIPIVVICAIMGIILCLIFKPCSKSSSSSPSYPSPVSPPAGDIMMVSVENFGVAASPGYPPATVYPAATPYPQPVYTAGQPQPLYPPTVQPMYPPPTGEPQPMYPPPIYPPVVNPAGAAPPAMYPEPYPPATQQYPPPTAYPPPTQQYPPATAYSPAPGQYNPDPPPPVNPEYHPTYPS